MVQKTPSANLARYLAGIDFPTNRQQIVEHARRQGARQKSLRLLDALPDGRYASMDDVYVGIDEEEQRARIVEPPLLDRPDEVDAPRPAVPSPLLVSWFMGEELMFSLTMICCSLWLKYWRRP